MEHSNHHHSRCPYYKLGVLLLLLALQSQQQIFKEFTLMMESISKGTRGWKERLFSPNSSVSELGSEVRRELNAKIASVSRLIERLETARENKSAAGTSVSNHSNAETSNNQNNVEVHGENSFPGSNTSATFSASPDSK
ncbi:hypothetical protein V8G54_031088 [Vigna mungo]|uniref:Uncharacterized protein n=1 Tax=Vigna mungo TaxID=3915 RepID=A0AAQ3RMZ4_VIGMU